MTNNLADRCEAASGAESPTHNFVRITHTTWDRVVPYWKCSKCGEVRAKENQNVK